MVQPWAASVQPPAYPQPAVWYHGTVQLTEIAEKLILGAGE